MTIDDIIDLLPFDGLETLPADDQAAVKHTLATVFMGFAERNAEALDRVYARDADWVNAFGTVKRGADEIVEYLRGVFADGNFNDGELVDLPASRVRVVTDDVVIVSTVLHVRGQGTVDGGTIDRANHSLHILARQNDGAWLIVSELFMDARTESTYEAAEG
jgi:uncharacterized protein (TIGR02246 family)